MVDQENPFESLSNDEVRIIAPDFALKKIIGEDVDIKQLFSAENVEKAQQVINEHKDSFLDWVKKDIALLDECYKKALDSLPACNADIEKLARTAFVIKSQAGTFGFSLATFIAKSLDDFCSQHFKPDKEHMTVIRKHIDTLVVIFNNNITGDGGKIGNELADVLIKLVEKYKK